eukprot:TRINITY_DN11291_c1_g1_i1.p1 TRINITY_DN11291_c1_g1~~TRINITY_DN11291_c1_g1_i1.p1  ORF type:complete len:594 (+),score=157.80 TRINITY_DN11291_c1_g1_i1:46-1827(+)
MSLPAMSSDVDPAVYNQLQAEAQRRQSKQQFGMLSEAEAAAAPTRASENYQESPNTFASPGDAVAPESQQQQQSQQPQESQQPQQQEQSPHTHQHRSQPAQPEALAALREKLFAKAIAQGHFPSKLVAQQINPQPHVALSQGVPKTFQPSPTLIAAGVRMQSPRYLSAQAPPELATKLDQFAAAREAERAQNSARTEELKIKAAELSQALGTATKTAAVLPTKAPVHGAVNSVELQEKAARLKELRREARRIEKSLEQARGLSPDAYNKAVYAGSGIRGGKGKGKGDYTENREKEEEWDSEDDLDGSYGVRPLQSPSGKGKGKQSLGGSRVYQNYSAGWGPMRMSEAERYAKNGTNRAQDLAKGSGKGRQKGLLAIRAMRKAAEEVEDSADGQGYGQGARAAAWEAAGASSNPASADPRTAPSYTRHVLALQEAKEKALASLKETVFPKLPSQEKEGGGGGELGGDREENEEAQGPIEATPDQVARAVKNTMNRLDVDGDGVITEADLHAALIKDPSLKLKVDMKSVEEDPGSDGGHKSKRDRKSKSSRKDNHEDEDHRHHRRHKDKKRGKSDDEAQQSPPSRHAVHLGSDGG